MEAKSTQKQKLKNVYEIQGIQSTKAIYSNAGLRKDYGRL
jgi:hypothetical protein